MYHCSRFYEIRSITNGSVAARSTMKIKLKARLRNTKPRDWWREVKQLCGTAEATGRDLRTILHPNLVYDDNVECEMISEAFVSVIHVWVIDQV